MIVFVQQLLFLTKSQNVRRMTTFSPNPVYVGFPLHYTVINSFTQNIRKTAHFPKVTTFVLLTVFFVFESTEMSVKWWFSIKQNKNSTLECPKNEEPGMSQKYPQYDCFCTTAFIFDEISKCPQNDDFHSKPSLYWFSFTSHRNKCDQNATSLE